MPLREVLEAHLLAEDIPLEHRGMRGRLWRAQISAERHKAAPSRRRRAAPPGGQDGGRALAKRPEAGG